MTVMPEPGGDPGSQTERAPGGLRG
jgi:hypothetical protein